MLDRQPPRRRAARRLGRRRSARFVMVMPSEYRAPRSRPSAAEAARGGGVRRWRTRPASSRSSAASAATGRSPSGVQRLGRIRRAAAESPRSARQAERCMDCGIPFCHTGCPVNNLIPDWNDLVIRDDWRAALDRLHRDQQFPRIHRPRLPGAVRGGLHAQPRRRSGDDQDDRMRDRRPRLARRLDRAAHGAARHRQADRDRRLGPGRPRLRAAARADGPCARPCSRRPTGSAACSATAFPISRWTGC